MSPSSPATVAILRHHPTRGARMRDRRVARRAAMRAWLASRQGALVLGLGAITLPAFAATNSDWDRFYIGAAGEERVVIAPMPFEKAGSSFPGSAFYYLDISPEQEPRFGEGIRSDADTMVHDGVLDPGPSAQSLRIDNSGADPTRALGPHPRARLHDRGGLLRSQERAGHRPARGGAGRAQSSRASSLSQYRLRRRLSGIAAQDRLSVQLHLRRIVCAPPQYHVLGTGAAGRAGRAWRIRPPARRPRHALPHRPDLSLLGA